MYSINTESQHSVTGVPLHSADYIYTYIPNRGKD